MVMILHVVVIEVVGGGWAQYRSIKWNTKTIESQRSSWGPTGPSLCSQHSKLKVTDIGQPFVACPALQAPMQESHEGLRKAATETRPMALEQSQQWNMIVY